MQMEQVLGIASSCPGRVLLKISNLLNSLFYYMKRIILSIFAISLLLCPALSYRDFEEDEEDDYETKPLIERTLLFRTQESQDWQVLGEVQIIRDYTKAQEVVAIKETLKLSSLRSESNSEWLFFKIDQQCAKQSRPLLASIPSSVAKKSDMKLTLHLAMETEECLEGLSIGVSGKQRRGSLKNRIFIDTKLIKSTFAKSPVFLHKSYNHNGVPKREVKTQEEEAQASQGSFLQRNVSYKLMAVVADSDRNCGLLAGECSGCSVASAGLIIRKKSLFRTIRLFAHFVEEVISEGIFLRSDLFFGHRFWFDLRDIESCFQLMSYRISWLSISQHEACSPSSLRHPTSTSELLLVFR